MTTTTTKRGAFELEDGLFFFAMTQGMVSMPIGHCSATTTCMACDGDGYIEGGNPCGACEVTGVVRKSNPCLGHPTPEEAVQHFREFLVDKSWVSEVDDARKAKQCSVDGCQRKGIHVRDSGFQDTDFPYCAEHCTREHYLNDLAEIDFSS